MLASIVHAIFAGALVWQIWSGSEDVTTFFNLYGVALVVGYGVSATIGLLGLARRRLLASAWILVLIPVYWLLLSLAAWRALFQLVHDPYRWEKTEHGVARTSRLAKRKASVAR